MNVFVMLNDQHLKDGKWNQYYKCKQNYYDLFCNPEILDFSEHCETAWEECSSYPGIRALINRPTSIKWQYMDEFLKDFGPEEVTGFKARVIQHEMDHLVGIDLIKKAEAIYIKNDKLRA